MPVEKPVFKTQIQDRCVVKNQCRTLLLQRSRRHFRVLEDTKCASLIDFENSCRFHTRCVVSTIIAHLFAIFTLQSCAPRMHEKETNVVRAFWIEKQQKLRTVLAHIAKIRDPWLPLGLDSCRTEGVALFKVYGGGGGVWGGRVRGREGGGQSCHVTDHF